MSKDHKFEEMKPLVPEHDEIYRGVPLEVYITLTDVYFFGVLKPLFEPAKYVGYFPTTQAAMRAGRELVDEEIKKAAEMEGQVNA